MKPRLKVENSDPCFFYVTLKKDASGPSKLRINLDQTAYAKLRDDKHFLSDLFTSVPHPSMMPRAKWAKDRKDLISGLKTIINTQKETLKQLKESKSVENIYKEAKFTELEFKSLGPHLEYFNSIKDLALYTPSFPQKLDISKQVGLIYSSLIDFFHQYLKKNSRDKEAASFYADINQLLIDAIQHLDFTKIDKVCLSAIKDGYVNNFNSTVIKKLIDIKALLGISSVSFVESVLKKHLQILEICAAEEERFINKAQITIYLRSDFMKDKKHWDKILENLQYLAKALKNVEIDATDSSRMVEEDVPIAGIFSFRYIEGKYVAALDLKPDDLQKLKKTAENSKFCQYLREKMSAKTLTLPPQLSLFSPPQSNREEKPSFSPGNALKK